MVTGMAVLVLYCIARSASVALATMVSPIRMLQQGQLLKYIRQRNPHVSNLFARKLGTRLLDTMQVRVHIFWAPDCRTLLSRSLFLRGG
jgi:hypothetical protein